MLSALEFVQSVPTPPFRPEVQKRLWTADEDQALSVAVAKYGAKKWKRIAEEVKDRNHSQCIQRWRKTLDPTRIKGLWSLPEDQLLTSLVTNNPTSSWSTIASQIPGRFTRQCRDRWKTVLDPGLDTTCFTTAEDQVLMEAVSKLGTQWTKVSKLLPGRTNVRVRDRWRSICRRRNKTVRHIQKLEAANANDVLHTSSRSAPARIASPLMTASKLPGSRSSPLMKNPVDLIPPLKNFSTMDTVILPSVGEYFPRNVLDQLCHQYLPAPGAMEAQKALQILEARRQHQSSSCNVTEPQARHPLALLQMSAIAASPAEHAPPVWIRNEESAPGNPMSQSSLKRNSAAEPLVQPNAKRVRTTELDCTWALPQAPVSVSYMVGRHQLCT